MRVGEQLRLQETAKLSASAPQPSSVSLREPPSPRGRHGCAPCWRVCRSFLALPLGELSAKLTERVCVVVTDPPRPSLCSDTSPKGGGKGATQTRRVSRRLPLVAKGSCRRRRLKGSERCRFAERHPVAQQNVRLLIPCVTASPCHLPLVTKGRLGCAANALHTTLLLIRLAARATFPTWGRL